MFQFLPFMICRMFSLLSRLFMSASESVDLQQAFNPFSVQAVQKLIIPNCVWQAGRYVL